MVILITSAIHGTGKWKIALLRKYMYLNTLKKNAKACARKNAAKEDFGLLKEIEDMKNNVSYFVSSLNAKELSYEL